MPTNGFSIKPLKVKLLAGKQKATVYLSFFPLGTNCGAPLRKTQVARFLEQSLGSNCSTRQALMEVKKSPQNVSSNHIVNL